MEKRWHDKSINRNRRQDKEASTERDLKKKRCQADELSRA